MGTKEGIDIGRKKRQEGKQGEGVESQRGDYHT